MFQGQKKLPKRHPLAPISKFGNTSNAHHVLLDILFYFVFKTSRDIVCTKYDQNYTFMDVEEQSNTPPPLSVCKI